MKAAMTPLILLLMLLILGSAVSCRQETHHSGIPPAAQATLDSAMQDIDAGRYEKLYNDAADEWRKDSTLDESKATLQRVREKLGRPQGRSLITAREEQTGTAPVAGHSLVAIYQTSFERGEAMETFTLIERGGQWYLAKYFVSSTALK
jgi:uncharacterized protein DUF4019